MVGLARFRDGINSRIWYQLKRRNIEIPFPIRTIHMHEAPDMEVHRQSKAVRKALGESVPRDLMDFILTQSERTRAEFLDRISKEFAGALSTLDPVEVVKRLLEGRSIEVSATIRLAPSGAEEDGRGVKLSVRGPQESE